MVDFVLWICHLWMADSGPTRMLLQVQEDHFYPGRAIVAIVYLLDGTSPEPNKVLLLTFRALFETSNIWDFLLYFCIRSQTSQSPSTSRACN